MASTVVGTDPPVGSIKKYSFLVTSHTDGTVANTLQNAAGNDIKFNGLLTRVTIVAGSGGDQPDDNWVMACNDDNEIDVFANQGAVIDEAAKISFCPGQRLDDDATESVIPFPIVGELDLAGSGMGSANTCTIVLYFS
jgi:hypothetical protein